MKKGRRMLLFYKVTVKNNDIYLRTSYGSCLFLGILFLAAGIYFYSGKAVNHITAWKTMPEEEKRKIHIRPLCRNVGMMIATSGIIFLLSGAWYAFRKSGFLWCMVGWMVLSGADVYWIGKSGRYQSSGK